jgi:hypothetical protein
MTFDALIPKLRTLIDQLTGLGKKKSQEVLTQVNLLLTLLPNAGFEITQLDIVLSVIPTVTIGLKVTDAVSEEKLNAILLEHKDKKIVSAILAYLKQASRLCSSVDVETIELKEVKILLTKLPNVSLQWKEKAKVAAAAAA